MHFATGLKSAGRIRYGHFRHLQGLGACVCLAVFRIASSTSDAPAAFSPMSISPMSMSGLQFPPQYALRACYRRGLGRAGGRRGTIESYMALRLPRNFYTDVKSSKIDASLAQNLGIRLGAVASFVKDGACVLDVGTDHGNLPVALVKSGKARRVIAADINEGPILNARNTVAAQDADISSKIEVRYGDGLSVLKHAGEVDTVTISGMGGVTMARILFGIVYPDNDVRDSFDLEIYRSVAPFHKGALQLQEGAEAGEDGGGGSRSVGGAAAGDNGQRAGRTEACVAEDEVIHSEAGWLYITHVASRAEASDSCAPPPAGNTSAELEVEQVVLGPGALLQDAMACYEEAQLFKYWLMRQLKHYTQRRNGILRGQRERETERAAGNVHVGDLSGGEGEGEGEGEGGGEGGDQAQQVPLQGNPGNLGPQKLAEADRRIALLSRVISQISDFK